MGFKISSSSAFWYPATLHDIDDNGKHTTHLVKLQFNRLPTDEIEQFQTSGFDAVLYADCVEKAKGDKELAMILLAAELSQRGIGTRSSEERADELMKILCGWKEFSDESGEMEFTRDNLVKTLRFCRSAYADIKEAYTKAVSGEAKKGN